MCPKGTQRRLVLVLSVVFSFYSLTLALQNCQSTQCMLLTTADVAKKLRLHCLSGKILLSEIEVATVLVLCHSVLRLSVCVCLTHIHTRLMAIFPGLPGWAGTRKAKPIWILLKRVTVSGSGVSWNICKSAPRSRQTTTPTPHHSFFSGRMPFLPLNQQRQSTEGMCVSKCIQSNLLKWIVLGPDHEYPPIHILYFTLCPNRTRQMISI